MLGTHGFFSFTSVKHTSLHRAYNEWHQLDHRPENLALDGVRYGERWVRTPGCAASSCADARLSPTHYVNFYWFRSPVPGSIVEWQALAERSFQWGRRPDMAMCSRPLMGFFDVVKGYVAPRVLVSVDALPLRPTRGVVVQVLELADPHSLAVEALYRFSDTVAIPGLLGVPGVAGVYTFSSVTSTIDAGFVADVDARTFEANAPAHAGSVRVMIIYCDEPSIEVHARCRDVLADLGDARHQAEAGATTLFDSALEVIEPWRWDWFDDEATAS